MCTPFICLILSLYPTGLYILCVGTNNLIYEGDGVVNGSMVCHWWKLLHPTVGSPFITVYNCLRMKVLLSDGQQSSSILLLYYFHIPKSWDTPAVFTRPDWHHMEQEVQEAVWSHYYCMWSSSASSSGGQTRIMILCMLYIMLYSCTGLTDHSH